MIILGRTFFISHNNKIFVKNKQIISRKVRLSYSAKSGKKPVLFFIHGAASNHTIWGPYSEAFKDHAQVLVDLRGHGHSGDGKIDLDLMVEDCRSIIKKEGLKDICVIGNSLGAVIAYRLAQQCGEVSSVVLASHYSKEYARVSSVLNVLFRTCSVIAKLFPSRKKEFQSYVEGGIHRKFLFPLDLKGTYLSDYCDAAAQCLSCSASLSKLRKRALVLVGGYDLLIKVIAQRRDSGKNRLVRFESMDSHHHIMTTRCGYAVRLIKGFLEKR